MSKCLLNVYFSLQVPFLIIRLTFVTYEFVKFYFIRESLVRNSIFKFVKVWKNVPEKTSRVRTRNTLNCEQVKFIMLKSVVYEKATIQVIFDLLEICTSILYILAWSHISQFTFGPYDFFFIAKKSINAFIFHFFEIESSKVDNYQE